MYCCFILLPSPPSTLFPYTTLFRSHASFAWDMARTSCTRAGRSGHSRNGKNFLQRLGNLFSSKLGCCGWQERTMCGKEEKRDRKSTRLNSSHRCISYAVFCLKKKKK